MDVYLVPVGPDGYELYCEPRGDSAGVPDRSASAVSSGRLSVEYWRRWLTTGFRQVLDFLEQERERRVARRAPGSRRTVVQRLRDHAVSWLAERVAEQRLLWRLRTAEAAVAFHPDDVSPGESQAIVEHALARDGSRHRNWLAFDAMGCVLSVPVTFIPGPNLVLYYFIFRLVGHYLSWQGARRGRTAVAWRFEACAPLTDLRRLPSMPRRDRAALAHDVAERLGLERIDTFAARMALRGA